MPPGPAPTPLSTQERQRRILELLLSQPEVRIEDLARRLEVHEITIRRDFDLLSRRGLVERVRGGARLVRQAGAELAYGLRATQQHEAKSRIARAALRLIEDGDAIGLDSSTSALALARMLGGRQVNAVLTGLDAAYALAALEVPHILSGGSFHSPARSYVGSLAAGMLSRLRLDKVFFSCKGLSPAAGFTDVLVAEVESKESLIASARQVVGLVDHSKFGQEALCRVIPLERCHVLITDREPGPAYREALKAAGTRLIVAEEKP